MTLVAGATGPCSSASYSLVPDHHNKSQRKLLQYRRLQFASFFYCIHKKVNYCQYMNVPIEFEHRVAAALPELFARRGVRVDVERAGAKGEPQADLWYRLAFDGRQIDLAIEVKSRWSQSILDTWGSRIDPSGATQRMLILPKLSPAVRSRLRKRRINHGDLRGVLYLNAPGIRIDVDADPDAPEVQLSRQSREVNPFSKKASLVLRVLLAAPKQQFAISDLAAAAGVAPGWASEVAGSLVRRGYAASSGAGVHLADPASALRDWSAGYTWKKNRRRSFVVPFEHDEVPKRAGNAFNSHGLDWALTLIAGVQQRIGFVRYSATTHVYVQSGDRGALRPALAEMFAEESPDGEGLTVLEPYYGPAAFFGAAAAEGSRVVSDVQLFLDLAHFPVRGAEAAEMLVKRRLAPALALGSADVKRLVRDLG